MTGQAMWSRVPWQPRARSAPCRSVTWWAHNAHAPWWRDERGTVTAELAAALPAVALVLVLMLGAVQAAGLQIRVVDAASVAARSLGRGESSGTADSLAGSLVGAHDLSSAPDGSFVCATVSAPVVFGGLADIGGLRVSARACALAGGK